MAIALSIDWDFFVHEHAGLDLGHSELTSPGLLDMIWTSRAIGWLEYGYDPVRLLSLADARPKPSRFIGALRRRGFTFAPDLQIRWADSHVHALRFLAPLDICRVVQFDTHHDLGYRKELHPDRATCEDWLAHLLRLRTDLRVLQIFPNWIPSENFERPRVAHWRRTAIRKRVSFGHFDDDHLSQPNDHVVAVFVAQSCAWAPPWLDADFGRFLDSWSKLGQLQGPKFKPRKFSLEQCAATVQLLKEKQLEWLSSPAT